MSYLLSQIFVVLAYACSGSSYLVKNKNQVFLLSSLCAIAFIISYIFGEAWSGMLATIVGLFRNVMFFIIENKAKNSKLLKRIALCIVFLAIGVSAVVTFDGVSSIIAIVATLVYTIGLWNEKGKVYKILGIVSSVLWIIYNYFIRFYLSMGFELIVIFCAIVGLIKTRKKEKLGEV